MPTLQRFIAKIAHDGGIIRLAVMAADADDARRTAAAAEGCPLNAVYSVETPKHNDAGKELF